jgi:acyl carrier protein
MEIIQKLRQMVKEEMIVDPNEVLHDDDDLLLSGRIDSLGIVRLIAVIEEDFKISIPPEDVVIENFATLSAIASYLEQRLAVKTSD